MFYNVLSSYINFLKQYVVFYTQNFIKNHKKSFKSDIYLPRYKILSLKKSEESQKKARKARKLLFSYFCLKLPKKLLSRQNNTFPPTQKKISRRVKKIKILFSSQTYKSSIRFIKLLLFFQKDIRGI